MHRITLDLLDIYQTNATKYCAQPLILLYDEINCGMCREKIVKMLWLNDVLSDKIRNEFPFVIYKPTRDLY